MKVFEFPLCIMLLHFAWNTLVYNAEDKYNVIKVSTVRLKLVSSNLVSKHTKLIQLVSIKINVRLHSYYSVTQVINDSNNEVIDKLSHLHNLQLFKIKIIKIIFKLINFQIVKKKRLFPQLRIRRPHLPFPSKVAILS